MARYGVMLKGLPFSVREEEIKNFFRSIAIPSHCIHIVRYPDGKGCGIGYVELKSKEELNLALLNDRNHIGTRYVEVSIASLSDLHLVERSAAAGHTPTELYKLASARPARASGRDRSPVKPIRSRFVYIQGIPEDHNYKEVRKFFSGCVIGKNCVSLVRGPNGIFRGDGFVEFLTVEEAQKALEKDGCLMNGHPIRVEPSSEEEALRVLGGSWSPTQSPPRRLRDSYMDPVEDLPKRDTWNSHPRDDGWGSWEGRLGPVMTNPEYPTSLPPLSRSPKPLFPPNESSRPTLSTSAQQLYLEPYARPSRHAEPYQRITESRDGYHTPSFIAQRGAFQTESYLQPDNRSFDNSKQRFQEGRLNLGVPRPGLSSRSRREAPAVLRLDGLPYNATVTDIVAFFRVFDVDYEDVRIQCRDDGSPSGKAFVTMRSEWLAKSAMCELNRQPILGRYIEMNLV